MKTLSPLLASSTLALTLIPAACLGDGIFVAPKFVWDKHKDINEPAQKAIIVYDAGQEDLILQVKYEGPVDQFGWLVPVPNVPTVQSGSMKCFYELSKFTQKRYLDAQTHMMRGTYGDDSEAEAEPEVKVIEAKTVGAYNIVVLSTKDSSALKKWLDDNKFYIPPDKSGVIDSYIQQHWYFIAVKINLDKSLFNFGSGSTTNKLASGELNPLQISFASDRCIFPLKISSINGKPSEVQVYVLASEPLLEQGLFKKELPLINSNALARAEGRAQNMEKMDAQRQARLEEMRKARGLPSAPPLSAFNHSGQLIEQMKETREVDPQELPQFTKATHGDLPDCVKNIPRLAGKSWWVFKDTWTFQPADMRDLDFGPALPELAEILSSQYGYIAAACLNDIGADAIPVLMAAIESPNLTARANAASILDERVFTSDPRIQSAALSWLKNSEPKVRRMAVYVLADNQDKKPGYLEPIIPLSSDDNADVRDAAVFVISQAQDELPKYTAIFKKMLMDTNPAVRVSGLRLAFAAGVTTTMDRNEWLALLKIPDKRALGIAATYFRGRDHKYALSDDEAVALLQNTEPLARLIGLNVLRQHADSHAIELARPLLNDPDPTVKFTAQRAMQQMTGQDSIE